MHGLYLMVSILRKIWFDAWQITTQRSGSGEVGIEVITFGLFGVLLCYILAGNHYPLSFLMFRYIYVPLGGSKNVIINTVLVFSFVALWHDLTFRLLAWGWLVSLFVIPELAASYLVSASKVLFFWFSLNPSY